MAGGMILVGVLLIYFDVATGMVIFSIIQFVADGWRAVLWWRFALWRIFFVFVVGGVVSFAVLRFFGCVRWEGGGSLGLCGRSVSTPRLSSRGGAGVYRAGRGAVPLLA